MFYSNLKKTLIPSLAIAMLVLTACGKQPVRQNSDVTPVPTVVPTTPPAGISGCRITNPVCSANSQYAGNYMDTSHATDESGCLAVAQQLAVWCQNPIGSKTKSEYLVNGVVKSLNEYTVTNQIVPIYVFAVFNPSTGFSDHWYQKAQANGQPPVGPGNYGSPTGPVFYTLKVSTDTCNRPVNTYVTSESVPHHVTTTRTAPVDPVPGVTLTLQENLGYLCGAATDPLFGSSTLNPIYEAYYQNVNRDSMMVRGLTAIQQLLNAGWTGSPQPSAPIVGYGP